MRQGEDGVQRVSERRSDGGEQRQRWVDAEGVHAASEGGRRWMWR